MLPTKPLISLENVTLRRNDKTIFQGLNFSVKEGEHWAIVGENNSGKTALLKVIEGNLLINGGKIERNYFEPYQHKSIEDPFFTHKNLLANIGAKHNFRNLANITSFYYQQRYNTYDAEDAQTVAQYLKAIQAEAKVESPAWNYSKAIETLDLAHLEESQVIKLSNGETKRLLIAAALLKNPKILMLDNPLVGLDISTRHHFNDILNAIIKSGITILMVTSPMEIPAAITHVAVLSEGKVIQTSKREEFEYHESNAKPSLDLQRIEDLFPTSNHHQFETIIKMVGVSISYGSNKVLDNIHWEVQQGERWSLSGPNGSGKSTLLSLITGDNPKAYANDITLFDKKRGSGESIWDIKKQIGFVSPELYQYFPIENTCGHVIESGFYDTQGLFRKSQPEKQANVLKWMEFLGIDPYINSRFKDTSTSTQRLCMLARALIKNPPLLILDEPCQGLNKAQQAYFRDIIDAICNISDTTLIYVTHYEEELPRCITHSITLQKGQSS